MSKDYPQYVTSAPVGHVPLHDPDGSILHSQWETAGWRCSCGATPDPMDAGWRWSGLAWEHHHGGQAGHFRAEYTPPTSRGSVFYDVCDVTDAAGYSIGTFLDLDSAIAALDVDDPSRLCPFADCEDSVHLAVYERPAGLIYPLPRSIPGTLRYTRQWNRPGESSPWHTVKIERFL